MVDFPAMFDYQGVRAHDKSSDRHLPRSAHDSLGLAPLSSPPNFTACSGNKQKKNAEWGQRLRQKNLAGPGQESPIGPMGTPQIIKCHRISTIHHPFWDTPLGNLRLIDFRPKNLRSSVPRALKCRTLGVKGSFCFPHKIPPG